MMNVLREVEKNPGEEKWDTHQLHGAPPAEEGRETSGENATERHADQVD